MKKIFVALFVTFMFHTPVVAQSLNMMEVAYVNTILDDSSKPANDTKKVVEKEKVVENKVAKPTSIGENIALTILSLMMIAVCFFGLLMIFAPVMH